ncbi:MAG: tRNA (guanosine(37)-N1)-methyltransferase TrmD [bacterium]|nr:tRNA (guanosine(37)-N1)-methyltransferase TrmD [bacterium]
MRIDIVSIFPEYLRPLELSLIGRAAGSGGPLQLQVHDLRDWTDDPHRTVDDSPAGGGAGMVMRPDIWGRALDDVLGAPAPPTDSTPDQPHRTVLAIPTPSGMPLTQRTVEDLATADHLVIACGRYEGIDARVAEHYSERMETIEFSLGDYVLNGGEVAALALVEAVARLLPGVVGNPESLEEESHGAAGLLEYPVYTRPIQWRGHEVPEVLLGGHHARIARWRRDRALERTAARRPDLLAALAPEQVYPDDRGTLAPLGWGVTATGPVPLRVRPARPDDAARLSSVASATFPLACPPELDAEAIAEFIAAHLTRERFEEYLADSERYLVLAGEMGGEIAGYTLSVLPRSAGEAPYAADVAEVVGERPAAELSKIYVLPEYHGSGLARTLLTETLRVLGGVRIEGEPLAVVWLGTNARNRRAQKFYAAAGFERRGRRTFQVGGREMNDAVWARPPLESAPRAVAD